MNDAETANQGAGRSGSWEAHEKFLRALLHVIAGIIAALTVIIAAVLQSLGTSTGSSAKISALYTIIFSEATAYSAGVLFLATVTAVVIQVLRSLNRNYKKFCCLPNLIYSVIALSIMTVVVLLPTFTVTKVAVCGAAALSTPSSKWNKDDANKKVEELLPHWLRVNCNENIGRWFAEAGAS
ncbi:MAG: hypothetical protein U1E38_02375 [Rhodospirillales bacterium]